MKTSFLLLILWLLPVPAFAQATGFYLPYANPSSGQDEFRASDGTTCRSTMDGTKRVEVGTFASGNQLSGSPNYNLPSYIGAPNQANLGAYGRFTWTLDAPSNRIDCSRLYRLEVEKKELEIQLLKQGLTASNEQLEELKKTKPAGRTKSKSSRSSPPP